MIEFSNEKEFQIFLDKKYFVLKGSGSDGDFYFSRADKLGYKIFSNDIGYDVPEYDMKRIIMNNEVGIESFLLPLDILVVDGKMRGYTTKYIKNNILSDNIIYDTDVLNFDFYSLKQAYKLMEIDVSLLTDKGILIYDLANNLVYDGKRLYAIDTCGYSKVDNKDLLKSNIESLDYAMDTIFNLLFIFGEYDIKDRKHMEMPVEEYLDYLKKEMNKYKKQYKLINI